MALTLAEIERIKQNLAGTAPELREELEQLIRQAQPRGPAPVKYVEVTHSDGSVSVMAAADYRRLTALDLAHTRLRVLTAAEAQERRG